MKKLDPFRVIIAGSRNHNDFELLTEVMDFLLKDVKQYYDIIIISGAAKGADLLGERYAKERNYNIERYPADWDNLGKRAGYERNLKMAEVADACAIFCIDNSKGSMHMYDICLKKNIPVDLTNYYSQNYLDKQKKE